MITRDDVTELTRLARTDDTHLRVAQAMDIFDDYGVNDYLSTYEVAMYESEYMSDEQVCEAVVRTTHELMHDLLKTQGVFLNEDAQLGFTLRMAKGIFDIFHYEDHDTVITICDKQDEPVETLAQLIRLVSDITVLEVYDQIDHINPDIPQRIRQEMRHLQDEHAKDVQCEAVVAKYTQWKTKVGTEYLHVDQYALSSATVGLPFMTYYASYIGNHTVPVEPQSQELKHLGVELFAMAILSEDVSKNILQGLRVMITEIYHDLRYSIPLGKIIESLFTDYARL